MTLAIKTEPSRGRLFKLFNDLGPYFRKSLSTESSFFFDCLEVCINPEKEPEQREFYGWWMIVTKQEECFNYQRFDGIYNLAGDWVAETISSKDQQQLDQSFELFLKRLKILLEIETGLSCKPLQQVAFTEA